jgi:transglutaminase-like putative cysteine protease
MDFSAWFEAFLGDRWWTFDARHNIRRIGRVLMATGRDATDCAITTSFGRAKLTHFQVVAHEVNPTTGVETEPAIWIAPSPAPDPASTQRSL